MWVTAVLTSLAVLFILILCVPVDMVLHADANGRPKFRLRFSWLFGLVSKEITGGEKKPEEKRKEVEGKRKRGESRKRIRFIFEILRTKDLLRQFKDLVAGILSRLNIRNLKVNLKVGLDNPADTGLLFAVIGPAISFLRFSFPYEITVQPSVDGKAVFAGYSYGKVRLRPIQLVIPLLRFAFSPATIKAIKTLVLSKWKRKK